jgi:hypothetical protein
MKHKSETFEEFKEFLNEVENQLDRKIKHLHYDRGGEYLSFKFEAHLKACGIVLQNVCQLERRSVTTCLGDITAPCLIV